MGGINADGIKEDVPAYAVAQLLLHLRQPRCFERTRILAGGVDQINGHDFAFDQIVIEMNSLPILGNEFDVGEMAPVRTICHYGVCGDHKSKNSNKNEGN